MEKEEIFDEAEYYIKFEKMIDEGFNNCDEKTQILDNLLLGIVLHASGERGDFNDKEMFDAIDRLRMNFHQYTDCGGDLIKTNPVFMNLKLS